MTITEKTLSVRCSHKLKQDFAAYCESVGWEQAPVARHTIRELLNGNRTVSQGHDNSGEKESRFTMHLSDVLLKRLNRKAKDLNLSTAFILRQLMAQAIEDGVVMPAKEQIRKPTPERNERKGPPIVARSLFSRRSA